MSLQRSIAKKVAKKLGLPVGQVLEIIKLQNQVAWDKAVKKEEVRFCYLGKFNFKEENRKKYYERRQEISRKRNGVRSITTPSINGDK